VRSEPGAGRRLRIRRHREDDRNDRCRLLCNDCCRSPRDNDVDLKLDELICDLSEAIAAPLCPPVLDRNGTPLCPTEFAQALQKAPCPRTLWSEASPAARAPQ
jgi:hypothetical protein